MSCLARTGRAAGNLARTGHGFSAFNGTKKRTNINLQFLSNKLKVALRVLFVKGSLMPAVRHSWMASKPCRLDGAARTELRTQQARTRNATQLHSGRGGSMIPTSPTKVRSVSTLQSFQHREVPPMQPQSLRCSATSLRLNRSSTTVPTPFPIKRALLSGTCT